MALTRDQKESISKIALSLHRQNKVKKAPIDVEKIANAIGLRVEYYPFPDEISGLLKKDLRVIGINSTQSEGRKRFTLAHEIGHYVLGHGMLKGTDLIDDASTDSSSTTEREASYFASVLLMPGAMVKKEAKKAKLKISKLAKVFNVSEQAMTIRLIRLGLISQLTEV